MKINKTIRSVPVFFEPQQLFSVLVCLIEVFEKRK